MFTVQFKFFQCRAASLLKIELQAYEIIVAGAFFWVAGEMFRLLACFDNPAGVHSALTNWAVGSTLIQVGPSMPTKVYDD